eukprot:TRINITY_DN7558_c0_g1_i2.p1 TRINITY_DN7558_c0_g1~~TRINITY_DN7558_c0_g1_i2.p1  ORF type:complete len:575 (+),score=92.15 TRINITY_DN7558_c0_g1_i2:34-1758(+)
MDQDGGIDDQVSGINLNNTVGNLVFGKERVAQPPIGENPLGFEFGRLDSDSISFSSYEYSPAVASCKTDKSVGWGSPVVAKPAENTFEKALENSGIVKTVISGVHQLDPESPSYNDEEITKTATPLLIKALSSPEVKQHLIDPTNSDSDQLARSVISATFDEGQDTSRFNLSQVNVSDLSEQKVLLEFARRQEALRHQREWLQFQSSTSAPQNQRKIYGEKGLDNPAGANNCFLNVILQSLWHLDVFKDNFMHDHNVHTCTDKVSADTCLYCAIYQLFVQYEFSEARNLPPHLVRQVLDHLFKEEHRFQLGDMEDVVECFEAVLFCLHLTATDSRSQCTPPCFVHRTFALNILERPRCSNRSCRKQYEPVIYSATVQYFPASLFQGKCAKRHHTQCHSLEKCLYYHCMGEARKCDGCGHSIMPTHPYLLNVPNIFVVGVVWSQNGAQVSLPSSFYSSFTNGMPSRLAISDIYYIPGVSNRTSKTPKPYSSNKVIEGTLTVIGVFYGLHYTCYCYSFKHHAWLYFDDGNVSVVGSLGQVRSKIISSKQQPALLFYNVGPVEQRGAIKNDDSCTVT